MHKEPRRQSAAAAAPGTRDSCRPAGPGRWTFHAVLTLELCFPMVCPGFTSGGPELQSLIGKRAPDAGSLPGVPRLPAGGSLPTRGGAHLKVARLNRLCATSHRFAGFSCAIPRSGQPVAAKVQDCDLHAAPSSPSFRSEPHPVIRQDASRHSAGARFECQFSPWKRRSTFVGSPRLNGHPRALECDVHPSFCCRSIRLWVVFFLMANEEIVGTVCRDSVTCQDYARRPAGRWRR